MMGWHCVLSYSNSLCGFPFKRYIYIYKKITAWTLVSVLTCLSFCPLPWDIPIDPCPSPSESHPPLHVVTPLKSSPERERDGWRMEEGGRRETQGRERSEGGRREGSRGITSQLETCTSLWLFVLPPSHFSPQCSSVLNLHCSVSLPKDPWKAGRWKADEERGEANGRGGEEHGRERA